MLLRYLGCQELLVPLDPLAAHVEVARIYLECRRRGITVRGSTDRLIAQLAQEREAIPLHEDEGFERIKAVRTLRTMPERPFAPGVSESGSPR